MSLHSLNSSCKRLAARIEGLRARLELVASMQKQLPTRLPRRPRKVHQSKAEAGNRRVPGLPIQRVATQAGLCGLGTSKEEKSSPHVGSTECARAATT